MKFTRLAHLPPPPHTQTEIELKPRRFQCIARLLTAVLPVTVFLTFIAPDPVNAAPPAKPTGFSAAAGDKMVTLSWNDPSDASITGWQYRQRKGTEKWGEWTDISGSDATTTNHTVSGLDNDADYSFRVRAKNDAGEGMQSNARRATPSEPRPDKPVLTAVAGDGSVALSWKAQSGVVSWGYQYKREEDTGWSSTATVLPSRPDLTQVRWVVPGLTNGTAYTFRLFARFASQRSSVWSDQVTATPSIAPPAKPTGFSAAAGDKMVTLSWNDPSDESITGWQYRQRKGTEKWGEWTDISGSDATTTNHTVSGLDNDADYSFRVRAKNDAGEGMQSNARRATPSEPRPDKPVLTAVAGDGSVALSWKAQSGVVSWGYQYKREEDTGWSSTATVLPSRPDLTQVRWVVPGLTNGTAYTFRLFARFASQRSSVWSDQVTATPSIAPPAKPTGFSAAAGDALVTLSWNDPSDESITGWQYRQRKGTEKWGEWTDISGSDATTTNHTVSGLDNDADYSFRVRAKNDAGEGMQSNARRATPSEPRPDKPVLTAVAGDGSVALSWKAQSGVVSWGYQYKREEDTGWSSTATVLPSRPDLTQVRWVVPGLTNGTAYTFRLFARFASQRSSVWSDQVTATPSIAPPAKPTGFSAAAGDKMVTLSWNDPSDASITGWQYRQRKGTEKWGEWTDISGSDATTTNHTVSGLDNDADYSFRVRAKNDAGEGMQSNARRATPSEPRPDKPVLTAVAGDGSVALSWKAQSGVVSWGYQYKREEDTGWSSTATVLPSRPDLTQVRWVVPGLTNGTAYTFRLFARFASQRSSVWSDQVTATPSIAPPAKPTGFSAAAGDALVTLSWNDPSDASITGWQYRQRKGTEKWGEWTDISGSDATTTNHTVSGLDNDADYSFRVRAKNDAGEGMQSNARRATPSEPRPDKPVLTAVAGDGSVALSWKAQSGVVSWGYQYKREEDTGWSSTATVLPSRPDLTQVRWVVPGLTNGTAYTFRLFARFASQRSSVWSDQVTATPSIAPPAKPTGFSAAAGDKMVTLSWNDPSDASITGWQYRQRKGTEKWGEWTDISGSDATTTNHTVSGLDNDADYSFRVRAKNDAGEGMQSNARRATPSEPRPDKPVLTAVAGDGSVALSWKAQSGVVSWGYQYKREDDGWSSTATVLPSRPDLTQVRWVVPGLTNGTAYTFRLFARFASQRSSVWSDQVTATPTVTMSGASGEISAASASLTFTTGNWNAAQMVTVTAGGDEDTVDDTATLINGAGSGHDLTSADVTATTALPVLSVPASVTVSEGVGEAMVAVTVEGQPSRSVTLSVAYGDVTARGSGNPSSGDYDNDAVTTLTLAVGETTQDIAIPIANDKEDESDETFTVTIAVSSGTTPVDFTLGNATTTVTIRDDDTAGVTLGVSGLTVTEGTSGTYTVVLDTKPVGSVTVTSSSSATAVATVSGPLTFSTDNWNAAQTVTVTAVKNDDNADGTAEVRHAVAGYDSVMTGGSVSVKVTNSDQLSAELREEHESSIHELHVQFGQTMLGVANDIIVSRTSGTGSLRQNSMLIAGRQIPFGTPHPSLTALSDAYLDESLRLDGDVELTRKRVNNVLDLLSDSSFNVSSVPGESSGEDGMTLWGKGGKTSFKRNSAGRAIDGSVTVGGFGFEVSREDWMGGVAYFRTRGKGNVTATSSGNSAKSEERLTMNSVHPYVHWRASEEVELWGTVGYGTGQADSHLLLANNSKQHRKGRVELLSGLLGTRVSWGRDLAFKGEMVASRTTSKGLSAAPMKSEQSQYKAVVEWSRLQDRSDGSQLLPKVEAGLRYDDDNYATGLSLVLAGSVRYTDAEDRWSWEAGGSVLRSRTRDRYRENGMYVGVELKSGGGDTGPSMSIKATQGEIADALQAIWAESAIDDSLSEREESDGVGTQLEFGYGLALGAGHMKPKVSVLLPAGSDSRIYETGFEYRRGDRLSLELTHTHKPDTDRGDGIRLGGSLRW